MERQREEVVYQWEGPFPRRDLPDDILYDVVLSFRHDARDDTASQLQRSLQRLAGQARVRRLPLLGTRLSAKGTRWQLSGRLDNDTVRLRVHHRLKGKALARLVEGLAEIPGARDLKVHATMERYAKPYTSIGPCSPCAAGRFGPSR